jgi:hypothetical protein
MRGAAASFTISYRADVAATPTGGCPLSPGTGRLPWERRHPAGPHSPAGHLLAEIPRRHSRLIRIPGRGAGLTRRAPRPEVQTIRPVGRMARLAGRMVRPEVWRVCPAGRTVRPAGQVGSFGNCPVRPMGRASRPVGQTVRPVRAVVALAGQEGYLRNHPSRPAGQIVGPAGRTFHSGSRTARKRSALYRIGLPFRQRDRLASESVTSRLTDYSDVLLAVARPHSAAQHLAGTVCSALSGRL